MKLYHITKNGTLHFQLKNGRLAAVYPETGYVRVSHGFNNFTSAGERFSVAMLNRFDKAVALKNPGNITMWPINKRIKTKTMQEVYTDLYYKSNFSDQIYKYPNKVFYEMESSKCETYPNDIIKLMDLLTAFEAKNC